MNINGISNCLNVIYQTEFDVCVLLDRFFCSVSRIYLFPRSNFIDKMFSVFIENDALITVSIFLSLIFYAVGN